MSSLMAAVYTAISAILLFWHSVWFEVFGEADALRTDWAWILGIVFLVLTVRIALFPLVVRQVRAQRAIQRLQPRIAALREKHRGDLPSMQAELAKLYQTEKIKPMASLLPLLVQAPILFGLLHVLRHVRPSVTSEASRTLYGWTLTQFDSAVQAKLFGAPIAAGFTSSAEQLSMFGAAPVTVKLVAAALILVMTATTYLTTRQMISRSGPAADSQARMVQRLMLYGIPLSLLVSGVIFPIGVVLYWVVQNLFALGQQAWILRRYPVASAASAPGPVAGPGAAHGGSAAARTASDSGGGSVAARAAVAAGRRGAAAARTASASGGSSAAGRRGGAAARTASASGGSSAAGRRGAAAARTASASRAAGKESASPAAGQKQAGRAAGKGQPSGSAGKAGSAGPVVGIPEAGAKPARAERRRT